MTDHLLVSKENGIATLTMNRPEVRNALSLEMRQAMFTELSAIEHDDAIRCVVIKGTGEHFMAGGDVKSFGEYAKMPAEERRQTFEARIHNLHPTIFMMQRMKKPIIASVQGAAAGFGLSLVMACDLAIAADNAFFTLAYVGIGTTPDGSGSYSLPRIVGTKRAMEITMLGDRFDAETAERWGIINRVVPVGDIEAETMKLAGRLAKGPTVALGNIKRLINNSLGNSLETQLSLEASSFAECAATDDWVEGVTAFAEKRRPDFKGK